MGAEGENETCLCNLLHVRTGAFVVAVVELIYVIYQIITTAWFFDSNNEHYLLAVFLILVCFILAFIAVVLLIVGIKRENPYLVVPHLLMQVSSQKVI